MSNYEVEVVSPLQTDEAIHEAVSESENNHVVEDEKVKVELSEDQKKKLATRRKLEYQLVKKYDRTDINPREECYFLIDSKWLNDWAAFTQGVDDQDPPGVISSIGLLMGDRKKPLHELQPRIDYRAVVPVVYYIFVELYGRDESPEICRYTVDIYQPPVPVERLVNIQYKAMIEAQILVNKIRPEWTDYTNPYDDNDEDDSCCCGWVTKTHLETFLYWAILCCVRRKDARRNIKYSDYKPLQKKRSQHDDDDHDDDDDDHDGDDAGPADKDYEKGQWLRGVLNFGT